MISTIVTNLFDRKSNKLVARAETTKIDSKHFQGYSVVLENLIPEQRRERISHLGAIIVSNAEHDQILIPASVIPVFDDGRPYRSGEIDMILQPAGTAGLPPESEQATAANVARQVMVLAAIDPPQPLRIVK